MNHVNLRKKYITDSNDSICILYYGNACLHTHA